MSLSHPCSFRWTASLPFTAEVVGEGRLDGGDDLSSVFAGGAEHLLADDLAAVFAAVPDLA